ncbi:MAG: cytochrome c oxidase subunit 2A [Alicyclobacillaceae bacterium]|nr:cytochrome c oxidase subunit 2A [Alicyclobacillaceae bacterium]
MAQTTAPQTQQRHEEHTESLRGTLASVMILGTFIVVCWLGVFILFLTRQ